MSWLCETTGLAATGKYHRAVTCGACTLNTGGPIIYFAPIDAHLDCVTVAVLDTFGTLALQTRVATREPGQPVFVTTCVTAPGPTA